MWLLLFASICGLPFFSVDDVPWAQKCLIIRKSSLVINLFWFFFFLLDSRPRDCFQARCQKLCLMLGSRVTVVSGLHYVSACLRLAVCVRVHVESRSFLEVCSLIVLYLPQSSECVCGGGLEASSSLQKNSFFQRWHSQLYRSSHSLRHPCSTRRKTVTDCINDSYAW